MKLSIVIPAYNIEKYIGISLESIISQSEEPFEVIVIDDASTDNTAKVVEEILSHSKLNNYRIIKKLNRGGVSSARNNGLTKSSGDYVLFLDGDDYVANDLVEKIQKNIYDEKYDIICWGFNLVTEDKKDISNYYDKYDYEMKKIKGIDALRDILINNKMNICTGSAAYRREFLLENNLKYTDRCVNGEDQEFTYKSLSKANKVIFIDDILFYYVQRNGSMSNSYNIRRFDAMLAFKRTYEFMDNTYCDELKEISYTLRNKHMINDYFANLNSCLSMYFYNKQFNKAMQCLLNDIDDKYPGLNKKMKYIMKNCKVDSRKLQLKCKAFIISPILYFNFISICNRIRGIRNKIKTLFNT